MPALFSGERRRKERASDYRIDTEGLHPRQTTKDGPSATSETRHFHSRVLGFARTTPNEAVCVLQARGWKTRPFIILNNKSECEAAISKKQFS